MQVSAKGHRRERELVGHTGHEVRYPSPQRVGSDAELRPHFVGVLHEMVVEHRDHAPGLLGFLPSALPQIDSLEHELTKRVCCRRNLVAHPDSDFRHGNIRLTSRRPRVLDDVAYQVVYPL